MAERARSGDTEAFGELIRKHREQAFGWACQIAGDATLAEDIVQEAFVKAFLHMGQLMEPNRFLGWLRQIVKNEATMKLRRGGPYRRERPFSSYGITGDSTILDADERIFERLLDRIDSSARKQNDNNEPMQQLMRNETVRLIRSLLQCLNERERGMFEAYFFMHCTTDEVAALFQTTTGSVHTYLHRSKKKIREALQRERIEWRDWQANPLTPQKRSVSITTGKPDVLDTFIDRTTKLLRSRGEQISPTEVAGRTGHAFRIKVSHKTTYADGVFVFDWKRDITALFAQYGYDAEFLTGQLEGSPTPLHAVSMLFDVVRMDEETVMAFVRRSIDHGCPLLFFDTYADRPLVHEWNLIYAYDDSNRTVEVTDTALPYRKLLTYSQLAASPLRFLCTIKKTNRPKQLIDPKQSLAFIISRLREGDQYMHQTSYTSYVSGLRAYETWIQHLEAGPRLANAYGHRYMVYTYASARSLAATYLRSLNVDRCAEGMIGHSAACFEKTAGLLQEASDVTPLRGESVWNDEVVHTSIQLLKKVQQAEQQALFHLEEALRILETKRYQWEASL